MMFKLIQFIIRENIFQVVTVIILLIVPLIVNQTYIHHVLTICWIYAIAAIGWNVCYGYAGLLSFGHTAFFGIGAYLTVMLIRAIGLTPWVGIFLASILTAAFGMGIAWVTARTRGVYFTLCTQAIPPVFFVIFTWRVGWWGEFAGGSYGLTVPYRGHDPIFMQFNYPLPYYYIAFGFLILSIWIVIRLIKSKFGYYLRAIGEEQDAASSLGINILRTRILGMGISTLITGISGAVYVNFLHIIDPYEAFGFTLNLQFILAGMLGGVGTIIGPVFGALLLVPFSEFVKLFLEQRFGYGLIGAHFVLYGIVLMFVTALMPRGLYPKVKETLIKKGLIRRR